MLHIEHNFVTESLIKKIIMGIAIGVILLLLFISWMNTNDCWALGLTTFFICFVLMFIGIWQQQSEERKKKRGF